MEISQLRYFLKVAERQSFTRAAEELQMTQPALSRSIARLEEEIGQPLFERQTRVVLLTDAGRLLQTRAEQILALIDDALAEITDDGESGRVRVGAIPTIAPFFLPSVLRMFRDHHPRAAAIVFEETTDRLLHRCSQGEVDLAILAAPVPKQYLEVEPLFEEELLLVLPADHRLADKKQVAAADIQHEPFVLLHETHCLSDTVLAFCRQKAVHPLAVERTSQLAMVQELVALGHGVSLIPRMAQEIDTDPRRCYLSLTGQKPSRQIVLVWNPYRFQSQVMERFKDCVREVGQKISSVNEQSPVSTTRKQQSRRSP